MNAVAVLLPVDVAGWFVRILATLGGALVGGLLVGLLAQFLARALTTRPLPRWGAGIMRTLGGIGGGLLVFLLLSGTGDNLFGLWGEKGGNGPHDKKEGKEEEEGKHDSKKNGDEVPTDPSLVRVAVLGNKPLLDVFSELPMSKKKNVRRYHIEGTGKKDVFDIDEIKKELGKRADALKEAKKPGLKVNLVIYLDSPGKGLPAVRDLHRWLEDEKLFNTWHEPDSNAPR